MEIKKQKNNLKPAIVDQILLWMVLLIGFVTLLFITIDYSAILRLKSNNDTIARQAVRLIALGRTNVEVSDSLNNIRNSYYAAIAEGDISCDEVVETNYQVIFNVSSTYTDATLMTFNDNILSKAAAFNETNSNQITCTLTLSKN